MYVWVVFTRVRFPPALWKISDSICYSFIPDTQPGLPVVGQSTQPSLECQGNCHSGSSCKAATRHAPWWRQRYVGSLFPGDACFASAAFMFHLTSSVATEHTPPRQSCLAARQLASSLATLSWASPGSEHLLGAVWVAFVCVFFFSSQLRSWRNSSLLFSRS
jgi:hypothetical protein